MGFPAKNVALQLLSRKNFFSEEIQRKLEEKGYSSEEVEEVLSWLVEAGYVNDQEHLRLFVEKKQLKGYGKEAIFQQLRNKCSLPFDIPIEKELIVIRTFLAKRYPKWQSFACKKKFFPILRRRGFSIEAISKVCGHNLSDIL